MMTITKKICLTAITTLLMTAKGYAQGASTGVLLKTNTLYDLAACPNVGLELQTDFRMALQIDYIGAWWNNDKKHRYFSNYAFQTELRYYLTRNSGYALRGSHIGLYGQLATYDFEFGNTGWQCNALDRSFGIGASYGYSIPMSRHWSLDLTAGIGYFQSEYAEYLPKNGWYRKTETRQLKFYGPTKLEAALVWNINVKNDK